MSDVKCIVCGTEYKYCPKCGSDKAEPWKALYCSANCKEVYHVCEEFAFGRMTADAAKNQLGRLDMSIRNQLRPSLSKNVADIYAAAQKPKKVFSKPEVIEEKEEKHVNDDLPAATKIETTDEE